MFCVITHAGYIGSRPKMWMNRVFDTEAQATAAFRKWYALLKNPHSVCGYNCRTMTVPYRPEAVAVAALRLCGDKEITTKFIHNEFVVDVDNWW